MSEPFIIYIDRLKEGIVQKINTILEANIFAVDENDLHFRDPVPLMGEAYLADEDLVLHLHASTRAVMPCAVCNNPVSWPLAVQGFYHTEPLQNIKNAQFDIRPVVREALLIELPKVVECRGNCPERAAIMPFLHQEQAKDEPAHYFPFHDLKL